MFDNGCQFDTYKLCNYLAQYGCQAWSTVVAYLQCNSQAKAVIKVILQSLFKKLKGAKGKWVDDDILWSIRTTKKEVMGETPFMLACGYEAILPVEVVFVPFV